MLTNDQFTGSAQITSVVQPTVGEVAVEDNVLVLNLPVSYAGEITFDYTITDEFDVESTATVTVLSANVLASVVDPIDEQDQMQTFPEALARVTGLFSGLISVRLNSFQLGALALAPLAFGVVRWWLARPEKLLSITSASRTRLVNIGTNDGLYSVRHDALVWTRSETRSSGGVTKTKVELHNGNTAWIDTKLITDTGY